VLESLQCGAPACGPLNDGLRGYDRILLATFANPYVLRRFRRDLTAAGIESTVSPDGAKSRVEVRYHDRDQAFAILRRQRLEYPDLGPISTRRAYDFTFFSLAIGAMLGLPLLGVVPGRASGLLMCVGVVGTATVAGFFADRICHGLRYLGRVQLRILDFFMFTFAVALLVAFWMTIVRFAGL
jgi:hypothetical protein